MGIFDPAFPFNLTDYLGGCGDPPYYTNINIDQNQDTQIEAVVTPHSIEDPVHALSRGNYSGKSDSCSARPSERDAYFYYDVSVTDFAAVNGQPSVRCPESNHTGAGAVNCTVTLWVNFASSLVTTQKSERATNTLRILTDEGSIAGGVLFLTWFLGIFVL